MQHTRVPELWQTDARHDVRSREVEAGEAGEVGEAGQPR